MWCGTAVLSVLLITARCSGIRTGSHWCGYPGAQTSNQLLRLCPAALCNGIPAVRPPLKGSYHPACLDFPLELQTMCHFDLEKKKGQTTQLWNEQLAFSEVNWRRRWAKSSPLTDLQIRFPWVWFLHLQKWWCNTGTNGYDLINDFLVVKCKVSETDSSGHPR